MIDRSIICSEIESEIKSALSHKLFVDDFALEGDTTHEPPLVICEDGYLTDDMREAGRHGAYRVYHNLSYSTPDEIYDECVDAFNWSD